MMKFCEKTGRECYGDTDLPLLFEISRMINNSNDISESLKPAIKLLSEYIDSERSLLTILDRNSSEIFIEEGYSIDPGIRRRVKYKIGEGIIGKVVEKGRPLYIPKIDKDEAFLNKLRSKLITSDRKDISFLCVPISIDNEIVGTISVYRVFAEDYSPESHFRLISIIGSMLASAVRKQQEEHEEKEKLRQENEKLQQEIKERDKPDNIIGNSGVMREVYKLINRVSKTDATVLVLGESGVGKELIADAIHNNSKRAGRSFIKVNCAALPDSLIESELFGHEKGAFTGAESERKGRFELAQGGTIFLDEMGDMPMQTQTKLLRTLQQKEFERIGGTKTFKADIRIITATNKDLKKMVEEGKFREDLYYRINVFPIFVPPLRERLQDIPALVDFFISKTNRNIGTDIKRITTSAIDMLMVYGWPGNIRELENSIENAAIMSTDGVIHSYNLPPTLQTAESFSSERKGTLQFIVDKVEKQIILDTLLNTKGNMSKAAKQLGITERMIGIRTSKYEIDPKRFKKK